MRRIALGSLAVVLLMGIGACAQPGTQAGGPGSPDQLVADHAFALLGGPPPDSVLLLRGERQIEAFANMDLIFPTRRIDAGPEASPLPERPVDLSGVTFEAGDETYDLERFIEESYVVGLLVIKDGAVALERYERGRNATTRWVSYSIAKSVVSLLTGAAIRDGYIRSVDDPVTDYLPLLDGGSYEGVTIRDALQMASGVEWTDGYDALDTNFNRSLTTPTVDLLRDLGSRERVAEPGERFNYNSADAHLLGTVVRAAIGNNLSTYFSQKIWRPFGMESDANWMLVEPDGGEHGGCCFSATLRDYGRLGLFAMGGGLLPNGEPVLADGWMEESTTPSGAFPGYGYLWWLRPGDAFAGIGIFGQVLWMDPAENLVIVTHSAWPQASSLYGRVYAFAEAVREALR